MMDNKENRENKAILGQNGFSPIIQETQTSSGYNISITDTTGTNVISLHNGNDGQDGYTPVRRNRLLD